MKGVIVQTGEPKSIVLFNNGKIGAIPTPADCHIGMVVNVKLNNKLKIIAVSLAAALLVVLGVFIGALVYGNRAAFPAAGANGGSGGFTGNSGGSAGNTGGSTGNSGGFVEGSGASAPGRRGNPEAMTVEQAKNLPDDTLVTLTGHIVQSLGDEKYTFRDSTGDITVEIDRKTRRGLSLDESELLEISGEVDFEKRQLVIDVKSVIKK